MTDFTHRVEVPFKMARVFDANQWLDLHGYEYEVDFTQPRSDVGWVKNVWFFKDSKVAILFKLTHGGK